MNDGGADMTKGTRGDRMLLGRTLAAIEQLGRAKATDVEFAFDDETGSEHVKVVWWAKANFGGTRLYSQYYPYPAMALEEVLARAVNGGACTSCGAPTILGLRADGYCSRTLVAEDIDDPSTYRYGRSCE
jgi:hypothetical protein